MTFKTILFSKCVNKTMLLITNFRIFNETYIKILKYLQKVLVFGRVNDKKHTITATWNHVWLPFFAKNIWIKEDHCQLLTLNFSSCVSLIVTLTNLLTEVLLITSKILSRHRWVHFWTINLLLIIIIKKGMVRKNFS